MGTLVVMRYPTRLFLGAADHTYVQCDTGGKAWSCWGGKTGGTALRSGTGSTRRANAIAEPNERGGITCYLINGVCHQAANRILFPAGILVLGARGYGLSSAIYGPYGRTSGPLGTCPAPFHRHSGVTGDLPECAAPTPRGARPRGGRGRSASDDRERRYLGDVLALYAGAERRMARERRLARPDLERFMTALFARQVDFALGPKVKKAVAQKLREVRLGVERSRAEIDDAFTQGKLKAAEFVKALDERINAFQRVAAEILEADQYQALFDLEPGEPVTLADPDIVKQAYPDQ